MNKRIKPETRTPLADTSVQFGQAKLETYSRVSGMTLIEVMVATTISMILVMAFYSAMNYQQKANATQDQVTRMQGNLRVATGMIERDLRMAGFGLGEQMTLLTNTPRRQGIYPCNGCGDQPTTVNATTTPDSIEIWANFNDRKLFASAAVSAGGTSVSVGNDPVNASNALAYFKKGDYLVIRDPATNNTEARLVSNVAANTITVSTSFTNAYPAYSEVRDIKKHIYRIESGNLVLRLMTGPPATAVETSHILAENIEDLQFAYGMDNNTSSPLDPDAVPDGTINTWVNDPRADGVNNDGNGTSEDERDLTRIAAVRVSIQARADRQDTSWARAGQTPPFFRQGLEDRTAAGTTDGYRRRIMQKTVFVRNLGLVGKYEPTPP
ncbi:MAG: PilW family protein [bacterium]|nr:PilW family protein [bacterium]